MFIIGVVIGGEPVIGGPGKPFYNMLAASTGLLGPAGWIPTLIAWRRAKDDKSGFKWSAAGGIVMALIGIMLLPGVLAIIGGTISKNPE
ncbi:hypothetical protein AKJ61_01270 [candidate division MSBL1 archaeon SCGC-AAA259B11]|uniref:Uncharacterized protein n=1 Tax=candidate division MSBL1 archaeon SCGC-AAA259B11 TaxID=1698260 RepID=A0A133U7Q4_9EURY|nr:hypothetical protein AKJ61_01270 [candidate division MSBL1 archaeon SCGC-AAA259B11]